MLGSMFTAMPGSSHYFCGGIIAYSNAVKEDIVDVDPKTLRRYGAVSSQVAQEMAHGVRKKMKTDLAISITGIAGPSGGTGEKPVGTVYICIAQESSTHIEHYLFKGKRNQIRKAACASAIKFLKILLKK